MLKSPKQSVTVWMEKDSPFQGSFQHFHVLSMCRRLSYGTISAGAVPIDCL